MASIGDTQMSISVKRSIKGRRPQFFEDVETDRLQGMMMAMATEMAMLYERVDTLERVAARKGIVLTDELQRFEPDETVQSEREAWRQKFLARLFYLYREELDDRLAHENDEQYRQFLKDVGR
jgi:hypothetical protein